MRQFSEMVHLTLGEAITRLEQEDPDLEVTEGFTRPHSNRGDYCDLGVEPCGPMKVGELLEVLRGAVDKTFTGYKGGEFRMTEDTLVHLSKYGRMGVPLTSKELEDILCPRLTAEEAMFLYDFVTSNMSGDPSEEDLRILRKLSTLAGERLT